MVTVCEAQSPNFARNLNTQEQKQIIPYTKPPQPQVLRPDQANYIKRSNSSKSIKSDTNQSQPTGSFQQDFKDALMQKSCVDNFRSLQNENLEQVYEENRQLRKQAQEYKSRCESLEQSLRNEMLNSEEQRTYLQIVKQELERKLEEAGYMEFFKTQNSASSMKHIDIYVELQLIRQQMLQQQETLLAGEQELSEYKNLKERYGVLVKQMDETSRQNELMASELSQQIDKFNQCQELIQKQQLQISDHTAAQE